MSARETVLIEMAAWFRRYAGASLTAIARNGQEKADACEAGAAALQSHAELLAACTLAELHFARNHVSGNFQGDDEHEAWTALSAALAKAEARTTK